MKSFIFCSISVLLLMCGCGGSHADPQLVLADSLMTSAPDSAYTVLKAIDPKSLSDSHNRAYYALLFTQAQYKALDSIHSDSLINIAVDYYDDNHDREKYTRTLIYKGAALSDMDEQTEALLWYKNAIVNADTSDYMNLGQANMRIAELYRDSYFSNEVDIDGYKIALGYYRKANNKKYQIMCLGTIGGGYRVSNIDSAYFYLNKAIDLAKETKDSVYIFRNLSMLARAYYTDFQYQKGKDVAVYTIKYGAKFLEDYDCYYDATKSYIKLNMMDSALYYFKMTENKSIPSIQVTRLMTLTEIEKTRGNYKKAFEYNMLADSLATIIVNNPVRNEVYKIEQQYIKKKNALQNAEVKQKITLYGLLATLTTLILLIVMILYFRKRNKFRENMALMELLQMQVAESETNLLKHIQNVEDGNILLKQENSLERDNNDRTLNVKQAFNSQINILKHLINYSYQHSNKPEMFIAEFHKAISLNKLPETFWANLRCVVDETYNNIITNIAKNYPQLTELELNFIGLLCYKFSNLQIMLCMGYTNERSVCNKRIGIATKMGIKTPLVKYLSDIIDGED